jgi:hypothetical protein
MWEKRSNWELGTRVPLIIRVPWLQTTSTSTGTSASTSISTSASTVGIGRSKALVELVDIFPTICDALGVPLPASDDVPIDGVSLMPLLKDPARYDSATGAGKDVALSTFPRCKHGAMPIYGSRGEGTTPGGGDNTCLDVERTDFTWMGYTMRTERWRYTEWVKWNGTALAPIWGDDALHSRELYDHAEDTGEWTDPNVNLENVNLAFGPGANATLIAALSKQLHSAHGFPDADDR